MSLSEQVVTARITALAYQACDILGVIRDIRDNCPEQWDAIMSTRYGSRMCSLWDRLRDLEKHATDATHNDAAACMHLEALKEIAKREGAYSRDPMEHARNTIDNMASIADAAINGTFKPERF